MFGRGRGRGGRGRGGSGWSGRRQQGQGLRRRGGRGGWRGGRGSRDDGPQGGRGGRGGRGGFGSSSGSGSGHGNNNNTNTTTTNYNNSYSSGPSREFMAAVREQQDRLDVDFGFEDFTQGEARLGWLLNMLPTTVKCASASTGRPSELSALELYFLQQDGSTFKAKVLFRPYFYVLVSGPFLKEVKAALERRFGEGIASVEVVALRDLDLANHLSGNRCECLKLQFDNVGDMLRVRSELRPVVEQNRKRAKAVQAYEQVHSSGAGQEVPEDPLEACEDLREYDVPYGTRVSIDLSINVGSWYAVRPRVWDGNGPAGLGVDVAKQALVEKAEPRVLAFDIECTKQPLKFPDAEHDQIFMISYMFDGQGFLIINREIVSEDIADFEYTPKPDYPGPFTVFNEEDERALLERFFAHCRELRPNVWVTYNGDFFDWPFVERRAKEYGLDMRDEVGVGATRDGEYRGRCSVHMDCMYWVMRDSYLPAGSRGLKAVTKAKLGYDPVEVDPEDMLRFAQERPHHMASYSVSDAVATYYLYDKYINLFVFSLCTIIPMGADDVLRKGSGTLCEMLLMVEAKRGDIVCPNKQIEPLQKFTEQGKLLEADTYIGGHVECLETGVYRDDLPEKFRLDPAAFDELIACVDRDLTFAIEVETGVPRRDVVNYDEVRGAIVEALELLRDTPVRLEVPSIYHLDVAAMYPNIILTNRLQPCAIVDEATCASCSFNTPDATCKRKMDWMWRGESFPASRSEFNNIKTQIEYEKHDGLPFHELPKPRRDALLRKRLKGYCQTVYKRVKDTDVVERTATVCQRENAFYVNTVKAFRDRRYEYKGLTKKWAKARGVLEGDAGADPMAVDEAKNKVLLYDSLQLAHKCILNSFYGYVMRKGARWHSMEMAGVVTHTGGLIIKQARKLVERVGRPLELDTDGIWCILPASFPENFAFRTSGGKKIPISYPCVMLNADVHARFTNHQYQDLVAAETGPASTSSTSSSTSALATTSSAGAYDVRSECSIFFEVDGPYRCMVLPASQEEGKLLKKRYAVFNTDGTLAELKGFELKRRGELKIIKIFQSQVFEKFLVGGTLQECYAAVAEIADYWLDVLFTKGRDLSDDEVIDLISENRSMSRSVDDYGDQKSTSISTARRLAEFLGQDLVKDKGLACKLLIAQKPVGRPTTERAIPTAIFATDDAVKHAFLAKWLKDKAMTDFDVRGIIDWDYYIERLGRAVQKIITIPAALQNVANPVPRVPHPDWLQRSVREKNDSFKQRSILSMFAKKGLADIEDAGVPPGESKGKSESESESESEAKKKKVKKMMMMMKARKKKQNHNRGSKGAAGEAAGEDAAAADDDDDDDDDDEEDDFFMDDGGDDDALDHPQHLEEAEAAAAAEATAEAAAAAEAEAEAEESTFTGWLGARKAKWARMRKRRAQAFREERSLARASTSTSASASASAEGDPDAPGDVDLRRGLTGFVKAVDRMTAQGGYWQILEAREERVPGHFKLFVLSGRSEMQTVNVEMPRTFYMNASAAVEEAMPAGVSRKKVTRNLPHAHAPQHLYRVEMAESLMRSNAKALSSMVTAPAVAGVYEMQLPLAARLVTRLGCVARVHSHAVAERQRAGRQGGNARDPFRAEELQRLVCTTHPYLSAEAAAFRRVFVFHGGSKGREVVALFEVPQTSAELEEACAAFAERAAARAEARAAARSRGEAAQDEDAAETEELAFAPLCVGPRRGVKCTLWVSMEAGGARVRQNMTRVATNVVSGLVGPDAGEAWGLDLAGGDLALAGSDVRHVANVGQCWRALSAELRRATASGGASTATVVLVQSCAPRAQVLSQVGALADLPVVWLAAAREDAALPALQWQQLLAARAVQRFLAHSAWLHERVKCARYAHVPVAHVGDDFALTMADTFFMRLLEHNKHVLWASPSDLPDLGGLEADDAHHFALLEADENPCVACPGVYRSYCVEIDIAHLAVNTVLQASRVHDIECSDGSLALEQLNMGAMAPDGGAQQLSAEGALLRGGAGAGGGAGGGAGKGGLLGSAGKCLAAFKILRAMLANWVSDIDTPDHDFADSLIGHFYRWLCSPKGLMYDPALRKFVHTMMLKVFLQLLSACRGLGAQVISANFRRVWICTGKNDAASAAAYCEHVVRTLKATPLFQDMQFRTGQFWQGLVFMDDENFGGVVDNPYYVPPGGAPGPAGAGAGAGAAGDAGAAGAAEGAAEGAVEGAAEGGEAEAKAGEGDGEEDHEEVDDAERAREERDKRERALAKELGMCSDSSSEEEDDDDDDEGEGEGEGEEEYAEQRKLRMVKRKRRRGRGRDGDAVVAAADAGAGADSVGEGEGESESKMRAEEDGSGSSSDEAGAGTGTSNSKNKSKSKARRLRNRDQDGSAVTVKSRELEGTLASEMERVRRLKAGEDDSSSDEDDGGATGASTLRHKPTRKPRRRNKPKKWVTRARDAHKDDDSEDDDDDDDDDDDNDRQRDGDADLDDFIVDDAKDGFFGDERPLRAKHAAAQAEARRAELERRSKSKYELVVKWNVAHYLPPDVQDYFQWVIGEFILEPVKFRDDWYLRQQRKVLHDASRAKQVDADADMYDSDDDDVDVDVDVDDDAENTGPNGEKTKMAKKKKEDGVHMAADTVVSALASAQGRAEEAAALAAIRVDDAGLQAEERGFVEQLVQTKLAQKLMRLVPQVATTVPAGVPGFPVLAGSHLRLRNPALELVKSVCAVLALDGAVQHEVQVLRRSLLRLIGVREFSPEAAFENPSLELVLRDVICAFCNDCTDLDLCRDADLLHLHLQSSKQQPGELGAENGGNGDESGAGAGVGQWRCGACAHPYDMQALELALVGKVRELDMGFQLQDLECGKCGQIRADQMSSACTCSGPWEFALPVAEQLRLLLPFANVAHFYRFEWLTEVVAESRAALHG